jgi:hypothetical protein
MAKQHRLLVIMLACLYCFITAQSWQSFQVGDRNVGVMSLALIVIIAGCAITVVRRLHRIARALT